MTALQKDQVTQVISGNEKDWNNNIRGTDCCVGILLRGRDSSGSGSWQCAACSGAGPVVDLDGGLDEDSTLRNDCELDRRRPDSGV